MGTNRHIACLRKRQLRPASLSWKLKVLRYGFDCINSGLLNVEHLSFLLPYIKVVFVHGLVRVVPEINRLKLSV